MNMDPLYAVILLPTVLTVISLVIEDLPLCPVRAAASTSDRKQQWLKEKQMRSETADG